MKAGLIVALVPLCQVGAKTCCFSRWSPTCDGYSGSGAHCDNDPTVTCLADTDCPDTPTPGPTPTPPVPSPPSPVPPSPVPPPSPPSGNPGTCCWSAWAPTCDGKTGDGARCSSDFSVSCQSDSDCPDEPAPTPPPPSPPTPPAGPPYKGFWYGYAGSTSELPAPSSGWFFSFPGLAVRPPFDAKQGGNILPAPTWGNYDKNILTQGGGDTSWGDSFYSTLTAQLPEYKPAGWDGVCWDWEKTSQDHTSAGFNALMKATKAAGLINILTSTAEGPYVWSAASSDATDIDWSLIDFFVPQIYGADGKLSDPNWPDYAQYWVDGAGKPNVHGVTFPPIPLEKILWGMPVGTCDQASSKYGGSGCVEWAYSPGIKPPAAVQV